MLKKKQIIELYFEQQLQPKEIKRQLNVPLSLIYYEVKYFKNKLKKVAGGIL